MTHTKILHSLKRMADREVYILANDLRGAKLPGAELPGADLRRADLPGSDLRHAELYGADLSGADLRCCGRWSVSFTENKVFVGCMSKPTITDWEKWFTNSDEEFETKRDTFEFREIYLNFQWACGFFEKWHAPARIDENEG